MDKEWDKWLKARTQYTSASADFLATAQRLDPRQAEQNGVCGKWSAREVVAHIVGWEKEVADRFRLFRKGPTPEGDYDLDSFNQHSVDSRKQSAWKGLIEELKSAQRSVRKISESLSEREIAAEKRFVSWTNILARHYKHHLVQIKKVTR